MPPLLIRSLLIETPSEVAVIRDITLMVAIQIPAETVIEVDSWDEVDFVYKFLKTRGAMDYIKDFTVYGSEHGIRVDTENNYPLTCAVPHIRVENLTKILGQLVWLFKAIR